MLLQEDGTVRVTYILVSYPVGVLWALHLTQASTMAAKLDELVQRPQTQPDVDPENEYEQVHHGSNPRLNERVLLV